MIGFLRRNAAVVGWGIVIFFAGTMFTGALFFGQSDSGQGNSERVQQRGNELARIGDLKVDPQTYQNSLRGVLSQINLDQFGGYLSPQMQEMVQYNALNQAIQNKALLKEAEKRKLKINRVELRQAIDLVLLEHDLKNKDELKAKLKESGLPYKHFEASLKKDLLVQKMARDIRDAIVVTEDDVDNEYIELSLSHILFSPEEDSLTLAKTQLDAIRKGLATFEDVVKTHSIDSGTREKDGDLGWIKHGMTVEPFENAAFSLNKGEISEPVKTAYGYHLIKVNDRRELDKPADLDYEKAKDALLQQRQSTAIQRFVQAQTQSDELDIQEPTLKAYHEKIRGNVEAAKIAYQLQVARAPYSPIPHYFLAQLHVIMQEESEALEQFKKAEVKADLSSDYDFAELHLDFGDFYGKQKKRISQNAQYKKAIEIGEDNKFLLETMKKKFKDLKLTPLVQTIDKHLATLKKIEKELESETNKELTTE